MPKRRPEFRPVAPPENVVWGHEIAPYANQDTWDRQVGDMLGAVAAQPTRTPLTVDAIAQAVRVVVRHEIRAALAGREESDE